MLILAKRVYKSFQDETQIRNQLGASFFFESCKRRTSRFLNSFISIKNSFKKLDKEKEQLDNF